MVGFVVRDAAEAVRLVECLSLADEVFYVLAIQLLAVCAVLAIVLFGFDSAADVIFTYYLAGYLSVHNAVDIVVIQELERQLFLFSPHILLGVKLQLLSLAYLRLQRRQFENRPHQPRIKLEAALTLRQLNFWLALRLDDPLLGLMSHHNIKVKILVGHDVLDAAISVFQFTQTISEHFKLLVHLVNCNIGVLDVGGCA